MKNILKLLLLYLILFLIGSAGYIFSFHTPLFRGVDVFFYRGIILILFWSGLITALFFFIRFRFLPELITVRDLILLFTVFCCVHVVFFTHVPVTGERSVSVFMLGYLADHSGESFQKEDIEKIFTDRYVYQLGAFDKRLHEQEETGTIVKNEDGGYSITPAGRGLVRMYETIDRLYGLDDSLLHSGP